MNDRPRAPDPAMARAIALARNAAWLVLWCGSAACRRGPAAAASVPGDDAAAAAAPAADASGREGAPVIAGRCKPSGPVVSFADSAGGAVEIGDAVALDDGAVAVGAVRDGPGGRAAVIAWMASENAAPEFVRLGNALGDAPPPLLARCGGEVIAAAFEAPVAGARGPSLDGRRSLGLWSVLPGGAKVVGAVEQQRDDSLAFDVACAGPGGRSRLVVWDETVGAPGSTPRGVIRAAAPGHEGPPAHDVSPASSDAELPRVVRRGAAGFYVVWLAHRPEPGAGDASLEFEAPAEARAYGWLEMVGADLAGNPVTPVQRLTPPTGHVSAYDLLAAGDDARPRLIVVARDEGESSERADGSGGVLLRVRADEDRAEPASPLPSDGLGRGAPALAPGPGGAWLAWVGPREAPRLLPLDGTGAPAGPISGEDALDDARPLLSTAAGPDPASRAARMLVAIATERGAELRAFTCTR
ncbi:MAG: hypothetical protein JOZ69_22310 [Myxococcales bacterium]|nr:hypothetical protein [Myxococcales bacterium]